MTKLSNAEIVITCFKEQGVNTVFGCPGGAILDICGAPYRHRDRVHHVLTSHEQGTARAAGGYACTSGKAGVRLVTSGLDATNLVTGIASTYMDPPPIVVITCNVANPTLGKDPFQEIDVTGIGMSITKCSFIVKDARGLAGVLHRVFRITRSDRPGLVLVDITKGVTAAVTDYEAVLSATEALHLLPVEEKAEGAFTLLKAVKKPCIMADGGMTLSNAAKVLTVFAYRFDAPICYTLMGQEVFNQSDSFYTGMVGMHGTKTLNYAVSDCDLLVVIDARLSDHVAGSPKQFAAKAKILQINIDEAEVNKSIHVVAFLVGDVMALLTCLTEKSPAQRHTDWVTEIQARKERFPLQVGEGLTGPRVIRGLDQLTSDDVIIVTEAGQYQVWTAQHYTCHSPRTYLTSGDLGTMGFGLGAAIGAQTAKPNSVIVSVTGDGCLRMNMDELVTVAREELLLIESIVDNHALDMVRQWQALFYEQYYLSAILRDRVDYCKIAKAMGVKAYRVTTVEELRTIPHEAVKSWRVAIPDVLIDPDEGVFPMCPPGVDLKEVFDESDS